MPSLLLVSLAAAVGMFIAKRWGQVLGIVMAVIYLLSGAGQFPADAPARIS